MININVHYDGKQEAYITKKKEKSKLTWPEFFLSLAGYVEEEKD